MNATLARLSSAVLSGIRQTTYLTSRNSGLVASHTSNGNAVAGDTMSFPGHFSTSIANERIPTESEINAAVEEWESSVDTNQLTETEKRIHKAHIQAIRAREEMYLDPVTGYHVYTSYGHIKRGSCCGNACRHCPYQHQNVAIRYKSIKKNNGAFYC